MILEQRNGASQNEWFGTDRMMTGAAMELHNQLVK